MGLRSTVTLSSTKGSGGTIRVILGVFQDADRGSDRLVDVVLHWEPSEVELVAGSWSPHPKKGDVEVAADHLTWRRYEITGSKAEPVSFSAEFRPLRPGAEIRQDLRHVETKKSRRFPHDDDASSVRLP